MATLIGFLATGRLGGIASGLSREDVREVLGDPEDTSVRKNPEIWKYGALELSFYRGMGEAEPCLTSIVLHFDDPATALPEALGLTGWLPTHGTTIAQFRDQLMRSGEKLAFGRPGTAPRDVFLFASGARVIFNKGRLHSIALHAERSQTQGKPINVLLPDDVLGVVRREAAERKLSFRCPPFVLGGLESTLSV